MLYSTSKEAFGAYMRIENQRLEDRGEQTFLVASISSKQPAAQLWFAVDKAYRQWLSPERLDAFFIGLLPMAMYYGESIELAGALSERLFYQVMRQLMPVLQCINPQLKKVQVIAESLDAGNLITSGSAVATGFSGGIDSFNVLAEHVKGQGAPKGYELTHLVYNHVGPDEVAGANQLQLTRLRRFADNSGLPLIEIASNLNQFYLLPFEQTHVVRNCSAVLSIQKLFLRYLYASTYSYRQSYIGQAQHMGYSNSVTVPLISTENLDFISAGDAHSRVVKTKIVSDFPLSYTTLDVCANYERDNEKNCSVCSKCFRTMFTLELLGKLELYSACFDFSKYYSIRWGYILRLLHRNSTFDRELKQLAHEVGWRFPKRLVWLSRMPIYSIWIKGNELLPRKIRVWLGSMLYGGLKK